MARKISFIILSAAILFAGAAGFSKLNYFERSARIFKTKGMASFEGPERRFPGRFEGGAYRGGRGGFERPDIRQLPDSIRTRMMQSRESHSERSGFPGGIRDGRGGGRGDGRGIFQPGKKVALESVIWFLAVFSAFTVVTIYTDRLFCRIRKKKCPETSDCAKEK